MVELQRRRRKEARVVGEHPRLPIERADVHHVRPDGSLDITGQVERPCRSGRERVAFLSEGFIWCFPLVFVSGLRGAQPRHNPSVPAGVSSIPVGSLRPLTIRSHQVVVRDFQQLTERTDRSTSVQFRFLQVLFNEVASKPGRVSSRPRRARQRRRARFNGSDFDARHASALTHTVALRTINSLILPIACVGVEVLGADVDAIHDGMAAEQPVRVLEVVEARRRFPGRELSAMKR